jgi:N-methylhydantoinase A
MRRLEPSFMGRYQYQAWEIEVPFALENGSLLADGDLQRLTNAFHAMHKRIYGIADEGNLVEFVTWKMTAVGSTSPRPAAGPPSAESALPAPHPKAEREVYLGPAIGTRVLPVYAGSGCSPGTAIAGPAIIEEETTTILLLPGMTARTDADANYWIYRD